MYEAWVDGSVRANPGIGGVGVVINLDGKRFEETELYIGDNITNNEAEYRAVIEALKRLIVLNIAKNDCIIYTDSKLVYGQLTEGWRVNFPHLNKLKQQINELLRIAPFKVEFKNISRWDNVRANDIAQSCTERYKKERTDAAVR